MDREAEDVIVVAEVKPLTVLQPVVDDSDSCHVVHHLPRLSVKQVVTTVEPPIPAANRTATIKLTVRQYTDKYIRAHRPDPDLSKVQTTRDGVLKFVFTETINVCLQFK